MENFSINELLKNKKSEPRLLEKMKDVVLNPESLINKETEIIYDVYREVKKDNNLRFDITILHPGKLENELSKTYGHYHKNGAVEIMEAVDGPVWWLLQRYESDPRNITEAYLVHANEGEKVVFPPDFGAISINPEKKPVVMSNWVNIEIKSDYEPYTNLHGACYYLSDKKPNFIKNGNYKKVPELIQLIPNKIPELKIMFDKPLIDYKPEQLDFLNNPQKYKNLLTIKKCYKKK
ncbi:MAG: glucose-6-phosphate isomerase family protein [Patescibacteria group bacterium]